MTPLAHALKALAALQDSVGQLAASVMPEIRWTLALAAPDHKETA